MLQRSTLLVNSFYQFQMALTVLNEHEFMKKKPTHVIEDCLRRTAGASPFHCGKGQGRVYRRCPAMLNHYEGIGEALCRPTGTCTPDTWGTDFCSGV